MFDVDLAREQARERGARGNQRSTSRERVECHRRGIGRGGREGRNSKDIFLLPYFSESSLPRPSFDNKSYTSSKEVSDEEDDDD